MWSRVGTRRKSTLLPEKQGIMTIKRLGPRQAYMYGERDRGANAAGCPLYVSAGRGCDRARAHGLLPSPPFTSWLPRPRVSGGVCFVLSAPPLHGVSPRDRWLCVLPKGQMSVWLCAWSSPVRARVSCPRLRFDSNERERERKRYNEISTSDDS
jgi:hypothetical protein